ncbi:response regulator [Sulfurimonas sp.]|uniref:response regulator n=1 Tax=Sulfurimonas sp. TaxID=2022749 RepID=UPI003564947D
MEVEIIKQIREYSKTMTILYVEDEPTIRDEVTRALKKIFKSVDVAANGQEGLKLYNESKYDIVLTDIEMPIMDGIEMMRQIKAINKKQIVAISSAYDSPKYLLELIEQGVDMFILKPFDLNSFFESIHKLIKNKHDNNKVEELEKQINEELDIEKMLLYSTLSS